MARMYHTLLPVDVRRTLRRDYVFRALIVLCFMLSSAGVIGIVSMFPAFVRATTAERDAKVELATVINRTADPKIAQIESSLAVDKPLVGPLSDSVGNVNLSNLIKVLVGARGSITINSLSLSRTSTSTVSASINGIAPTRESLIGFKGRLDSAVPGGKADFPISLLAKSSDIGFTIQVNIPTL